MTIFWHLPFHTALRPGFRLALGILLFLSPVSTARAQSLCGESAALASQLSERFGEVPAARGVTVAGRLLQVFVSKGGTWTILVVLPDARACVVSHGEGWQRLSEPEGRAGQPS